jgi:hypothetical protein
MARSRAVGAREPGQVREEAALSDTAHAPRGSLTGVEGWKVRSRPGFDGGCTVHLFTAGRGAGAGRAAAAAVSAG